MRHIPAHRNSAMSTENTGSAFRQGEVTAAIWPWCRAAANRDPKAAVQALRRKAVIQAVVAGVIGALLFFLLKHRLAGWIVWGVAAFVLLSGLFAPPVFQAVDRFMKRFGQAFGTGLTYLLLVPFFYLVFMPGHFIMQLLAKDPLQLRAAPDRDSFWSVRRPLKPDHFKKQF